MDESTKKLTAIIGALKTRLTGLETKLQAYEYADYFDDEPRQSSGGGYGSNQYEYDEPEFESDSNVIQRHLQSLKNILERSSSEYGNSIRVEYDILRSAIRCIVNQGHMTTNWTVYVKKGHSGFSLQRENDEDSRTDFSTITAVCRFLSND